MRGRRSVSSLHLTSVGVGGRRGSVLVIVMVTLLFAVTALLAFIERAGDDLIVEAREASARRLRLEAYSALDVTLAVLEDFRLVNGGLHSPAEGWGDPLGFAGWQPADGRQAEVAFEDESGKLSLPNMDPATMLNLFESWGLNQSESERLTDALFSWMREDYVPTGARLPDYERGEIPYGPPHRSLRSYSELAAIDVVREMFYDEHGRPNELWMRFVDAVSLYDFKQTNINAGREGVYAAFGVKDLSQQQRLNDYIKGAGSRERFGPGYFQSPGEAASLIGAGELPQAYGTQISALRVIVTIREGRTAFRVSAVVSPVSGGAKVVEPRREAGAEAQTTTNNEAAAQNTGTPAAAAEAAKKLSYPFTLLEIRENTEISAVPTETPQA